MDWKRWMEQRSGDPQWWLRTVLGVAAVLLLLWLVVVSRMEFGLRSNENVSSRIEAVRGASSGYERLPNETRSSDKEKISTPRRDSTEGPFAPALTTFLVLITLLVGVWYLTVRRSGKTASVPLGSPVRTIPLSSGSELSVIRINGEVWVVGTSPQGSVQLLHRVPEEEWSDPDPEPSASADFQSIWNRLRSRNG